MSGEEANREQAVRREVLALEPAEALAGLLDIDVPQTEHLPPLWHWVYLLERRPQRDLGRDGHPVSGIPAPPGPGLRRMFAGGRVRHHRRLVLGHAATRTTWVASTRETTGRAGPLVFVTVRNEIVQDGALAIEDEQDIVYRADTALPGPAVEADPSRPAEPTLTLEVDTRLLFRFSALTYNAHRIHYDHDFARQEGYDNVVVHGPLQALMMGELLRRNDVDLVGREYVYRLVVPMVGPQRMTVAAQEGGPGSGAETRDAAGTVTATAGVNKP